MTATDVYQPAPAVYTIAMPWADGVTAEAVIAAAATLPGTVLTCVIDRDRRTLTATGGWDACFDARLHFRRHGVVHPWDSTMRHLDSGREIGMRLI